MNYLCLSTKLYGIRKKGVLPPDRDINQYYARDEVKKPDFLSFLKQLFWGNNKPFPKFIHFFLITISICAYSLLFLIHPLFYLLFLFFLYFLIYYYFIFLSCEYYILVSLSYPLGQHYPSSPTCKPIITEWPKRHAMAKWSSLIRIKEAYWSNKQGIIIYTSWNHNKTSLTKRFNVAKQSWNMQDISHFGFHTLPSSPSDPKPNSTSVLPMLFFILSCIKLSIINITGRGREINGLTNLNRFTYTYSGP